MASNDAVRASSRPKKRSTNLRATWVEMTRSAGAWNVPTLSAREWRSATDDVLGANGSWTWTKSSGAAAEHVVERARDVERRRGRHAPPRGRERQQLPDAEHAHAAVGIEELARADQPARLAHQLGRARRREHDDPVPARGEPVRERAHEGVDLVLVLPRMGRDLRDGEGLAHQRGSIGGRPRGQRGATVKRACASTP